MQRVKSASSVLSRYTANNNGGFISRLKRSLSSLSNSPLTDDQENFVLVEGNGASRTAILNRPSVLNALNTSIGARLQKLYSSWEDDPDIGIVQLKGRGRAFCAGGDIVALYNVIRQGNIEQGKEFFWTIYNFIYMLGTYLKPHVALLHGITMGGGAGVSIPGTFRVATDKTVFATPETLIGFHPDAGASFYLSHLPGYLGEYLALTGDKLNGVEMLSCGLATHYSLAAKLPLIEEQLGSLTTDDPSVIEGSLQNFGDLVHPDPTSVVHWIETLDKCFGHDTVEEIIDALESEASRTKDVWSTSTLKKLKDTSPLSLKVSLRSIREGRFQTLDQCLIREYRMSLQGISGKITSDFCEGVRARLVDKDSMPKFNHKWLLVQYSFSLHLIFRDAQWNPPSLELVTADMVDEYFSPVTALEPDLELPTKLREAFL
ncbi:3-hydroxyisobutyryl-CoA hydrolase-like protein 1, mitochondrial isoform X2 [Coffea arabica]|uniref:3-hydroxyisobutyryl-CoA hydrolase n=1 Tax=Coffea arabica TaxID=13443 RepID=A0ABM4WI01_COFAR